MTRRASYQPLHSDDYDLAVYRRPKNYRGRGAEKLNTAEAQDLAKTLLLRGWRASKVAVVLGYDNRMNFYRAFKQLYGKSPRAWADEQGVGPRRTQ